MDVADSFLIVAIGDVRRMQSLLPRVVDSGAVIWFAPTREAAARLLDGPSNVEMESPIFVGRLEIDLPAMRVTDGDSPIPLTRAEIHMLALLARRPGRVFSFAEITEAAWECAYLGDSAGVRSAIKRLRKKLDHANSSIAIESARGTGYRLVDVSAARSLPLPHAGSMTASSSGGPRPLQPAVQILVGDDGR